MVQEVKLITLATMRLQSGFNRVHTGVGGKIVAPVVRNMVGACVAHVSGVMNPAWVALQNIQGEHL